MPNNYVFYIGCLVLLMVILSILLVGTGYTLILSGIGLLFLYKQTLDYNDSGETERRKSLERIVCSKSSHVSSDIYFYEGTRQRQNTQILNAKLCDTAGERLTFQRLEGQDPLSFLTNMWENRTRSPAGIQSNSRVRLNSTMPALSSSPLVTRQRNTENRTANKSFLRDYASPNGKANNTIGHSTNGPLLSSPFMPQIKRALGLEPTNHSKYRYIDRYYYIILKAAETSVFNNCFLLPSSLMIYPCLIIVVTFSSVKHVCFDFQEEE